MLLEYFSMSITAEGMLESLPLLLPGFMPNINNLPLCKYRTTLHIPSILMPLTHPLALLVMIRVGVQVDWTNEKECFDSFLKELAYFYIARPVTDRIIQSSAAPDLHTISDGDEGKEKERQKEKERIDREKHQLQHIVFPAAKLYLEPPESMVKADFIQVTRLESLYKVYVQSSC